MDGQMKFFLLAEESGWDCSAYALQYTKNIYSSNAYNVLNYNVIEARKSLSGKAKEVVAFFDEFKPDSRSVRDAFILDSKLNYMALHSFPEYYLNPLAVSPEYVGEITTIGELMFDINGTDYALNDIIMDETIDMDIKKEAVRNQLDEYVSDMDALINDSLVSLRRKAFAKEKKESLLNNSLFASLQFILMNILLLIFFIIPYDDFRTLIYYADLTKFTTYLIWLLPILVFLNDLVYVIYHSYRARISEPFNYAKRFMKKYSDTVFEDVSRERDRMYAYICGAITNKLLLSDDIRKFSKLSSSYVNIDEVLHVSALKEKKAYKVLENLSRATITVSWIVMFVSIVIFTLNLVLRIII